MGLSHSDIIKFVILLVVICLIVGLCLGIVIGCGTTYTTFTWSEILGETSSDEETETENAEKENDDGS